MGHEIDVKAASEPSDIIWENRHWTSSQRVYKKVFVYGVIIMILYSSFQTIFRLTKKSLAMSERYPYQLCDEYAQLYQGKRQQWMNDAIHEYIKRTDQIENTDNPVYFTGPM